MASISLLISTCEKFSDLWDEHIALLRKHWKGSFWKVYMVTDKPTEKKYDGIEIISAGMEKDFPLRLKFAAEFIQSDYILLTLDDYFLTDDIDPDKLMYLADRAEKERIRYLKLYDRRRTNPRNYDPIEQLTPIDLDKKYAVTLYPAIWEKDFLFYSVETDISPWQYEPSLTLYAKNCAANCMFSHTGCFPILDVVRKGKVLHKANGYFKRNGIDIGDRPLISRAMEVKLTLMDWISWYTPRKAFVAGKKVLRKMGLHFYSDD